jgi:O-antigen ligase
MPEHLRAFAFVVLLSVALWPALNRVFAPLAGGGLRQLLPAWYWVTAFAFLSHSFWIYALLTSIFVMVRFQRASPAELCALFCLLLFAVPPTGPEVPGVGGVAYLFELTNTRMLTLLLLIPAISRLKDSPNVRLLKSPGGKMFVALFMLFAVLQTRDQNLTNSLRKIFVLFLDFGIPYYAFSRATRTTDDFRLILGAFCTSVAFLSAMAFFEFLRSWNLYLAMMSASGVEWSLSTYLPRDGMLRATGTSGQAIVMGFVAATALGFWLNLSRLIPSSISKKAVSVVLALGFFASLSRGPWLGFLAMFMAHSWLQGKQIGRLIKIGALAVAAVYAASFTPQGARLVNLLPFVGKVDSENTAYRQKLFDNSMLVIEKNLWLGSENYLETPEMQEMIQGQGIIDIVNTYILIALDNGVIGLTVFIAFFLSALLSVVKKTKQLEHHREEHSLGLSLASTLAGILLMIVSVSPISFVPTVLWIVAALCSAFSAMQVHPRGNPLPKAA